MMEVSSLLQLALKDIMLLRFVELLMHVTMILNHNYLFKGTNTAADYEKIGDIYPSLVDLLKKNSEHFRNRITNQVHSR